MPYHTGTMQSSRFINGVGCQYRYIEDLWGNVQDGGDGIYFSDANIYCILNPNDFSDTSNGANIGKRPTSGGWISAYNVPTVSGFEWALYPSAVSGSESTYICDFCNYNSSGVVLYCGGYFDPSERHGLFCVQGNGATTYHGSPIGCRLIKLP